MWLFWHRHRLWKKKERKIKDKELTRNRIVSHNLVTNVAGYLCSTEYTQIGSAWLGYSHVIDVQNIQFYNHLWTTWNFHFHNWTKHFPTFLQHQNIANFPLGMVVWWVSITSKILVQLPNWREHLHRFKIFSFVQITYTDVHKRWTGEKEQTVNKYNNTQRWLYCPTFYL